MNVTFILILTLLGSGGSNGQLNPSVAHVPGFTSQAACMKAANLWLKQVNTMNEQLTYRRLAGARAACVSSN